LLGNAILSQFAIPPGSFNYLPSGQQNYLILVDGLQRFAVGTSVLSVLNKEVLTASPNRPGDATFFTALAARVAPLSPYYTHNNIELSDHPRQAIRDQYKVLRTAVSTYIMQELDAGRGKALADKIVSLFLSRQVALDIYFNFNSYILTRIKYIIFVSLMIFIKNFHFINIRFFSNIFCF
jgi:hypothetical protein